MRLGLALALLLHGCALRELGREIETIERLGSISGDTRSLDGPGGPTLVMLYHLADLGPVLVDYRVQLQPGSFAFVQRPGRYVIEAFEDLNRDFVYQPGEPSGRVGRTRPIELRSSGAVSGLLISMTREDRPGGGLELDLRYRRSDANLPAPRRNVGVVASLDDARFSASSGRAASERPLEALLAGAVGVFFLEPYDPARIPVLYIHGMNGSPQDMRPLIEKLDRERFQAWFVAYPSTLRLDALATLIHEAVLDLGVTYDLRRLYVVAHSMGGLVGLSFINKNVAEKKRELVQLFISLSTPFGGERSAGVLESVPGALKPRWVGGVSWVDMVPNSQFLQDLYYAPLAPYVEHHLFFAYLPGELGDGAIELSSQLDTRAEASAHRLYAEPASHTGILESTRVHARIRDILDAAWERDASALRPDLYVERTAVELSAQSEFRFEWQADERPDRMRDFERVIRAQARSLNALLRDPVVLDAVRRANADPQGSDERVLVERDRRWRAGDVEAVIAEATDASCNAALRDYTAREPAVAEIIVTGRSGGNVCQSQPTSDYYQADEAWWTRTALEARAWHDSLRYDESVDAYGVSVHLPLRGRASDAPEGRPIGIVKVLVREP